VRCSDDRFGADIDQPRQTRSRSPRPANSIGSRRTKRRAPWRAAGQL